LCVALHCHAEARFVFDSYELNSFEMLPVFFQHIDVGLACLPSQHCSHRNHSFTGTEDSNHNLGPWWRLFEFVLRGACGWCHSTGCVFVSHPKLWSRLSSAVTVWDRKVSPSASKLANNSEEIALLSVLCSTGRLWAANRNAHLGISKILNDVTNTSFADWKTECRLLGGDALNLANDGFSMLQHFRANGCDRMVWVSQIRDLSLFFLFWKPSLFSPSDQQCFCQPQHFHKHGRWYGCFWLTLSQQQEIKSQHGVCSICHWLTALWGTAAVSEITFLILFLAKKKNMGHCFLLLLEPQ